MVNINLSTGQSMQGSGQGLAQKGMFLVAAVLVFIGIVTGALMLWGNSLDNKIEVTEAAYAEKSVALMTSARNKDIVDFQNRISLVDGLVAQPNVSWDILQEVEKTLVSGVSINSFAVDVKAKTLALECVADNYEAVARQALSFKGSKSFSDVSVKNVSISNEGKNIFSADIKLINLK